MSNWIDMRLDVLASSPEEINQIERALQDPREELLKRVAKKRGGDPKEIASDVKVLVTLKPTRNLGHLDPSVNKARRFENEWKDKFWGVVWSHVLFVSEAFPEAIFLGEYWDISTSCAGKRVIRGGREIRHIHDGKGMGREEHLRSYMLPTQSGNQHVPDSRRVCGMKLCRWYSR
jgi:hypothetical protein